MRVLLAASLAVAVLGTGCVLHTSGGRAYAPMKAEKAKCPPGHQWSDGQCHAKGKGNDPAKHR